MLDLSLRIAADKGFAPLLTRFADLCNARFDFSADQWKDPSTGRNSSIGNANLKQGKNTLISIRIYNPDETGKNKFDDIVIGHGALLAGFRSTFAQDIGLSKDAFENIEDLRVKIKDEKSGSWRYFRFTSIDEIERFFSVL